MSIGMLPDYPETKRLFAHFFQTYMRRKARELSPLGAVQIRYLHEGRGMKIVRSDNSESNTGTHQLTSEMVIKFDEIKTLTFEKAIQKYDELILDMVRKQTGMALEELGNQLPESQTVDAKGRKLDARMILEVFETVELQFHPDGSIQPLHVVGPLFTEERLKAAEEELKNDPELQKQYDELIERKRENWRAREASRKLVG